jgi:hypothetical protein
MPKSKKDNLKLVTYCGLHCDLCSARGRLPRQAATLRDTMRKEGWEYWGDSFPRFKEFWQFLNDMSEPEKSCPGCRQGGGPPFCGIRKCARKKGIDLCIECEEWPCSRIDGLAAGYINLIADSERHKRIGTTKWLKEQTARAATGFCYCDIRCHPYTVPDK